LCLDAIYISPPPFFLIINEPTKDNQSYPLVNFIVIKLPEIKEKVNPGKYSNLFTKVNSFTFPQNHSKVLEINTQIVSF